MTSQTKKLLVWGAVIVGAVILWKKFMKPASSSSSGAAAPVIAVGSMATATPVNAGAAVPSSSSAGLNPAK